jgi:capsular polysaccharide biosynthesis protein
MTLHDFIKLIFKKKQTFISVLFIFLLIAGSAILIQRPKYGADSKILTLHTYEGVVDPYVSARSNDYLSGLFSRIIYSNSFLDKVLDSDFTIDKDYFKGSDSKKIKLWAKTIKAKSIAETGIMELEVYHPDKVQAEQISRAVIFTLQTNHSLYHGFGSDVQIKELDSPTASTYPVKPDVILILVLAAALALGMSTFYIYIFPEEKYDIRLWPRAKKKEKKAAKPDNNWTSVSEMIAGREDYKEENDSVQPVQNEQDTKIKEEEIREDEIDNYEDDYRQDLKKDFDSGDMDNILR